MNRKLIISGVVLAFVSLMIGFVIHGLLLHAEYAKLPNLFRPEAEGAKYFHFMIIAHILLGFGMAWIYGQGVKDDQAWLGQGLRFGVAVNLMMTVPMYTIYYAVQPTPEMLAIKQIVYDFVGTLLMGVVAAWFGRARR